VTAFGYPSIIVLVEKINLIEKDKNSRNVVKRKVGLVLQFFLNFDLFLFFNVVSNNMYEKIIKWFFM
jgi:ABC-type polar amino acid transport system ATPase subunit